MWAVQSKGAQRCLLQYQLLEDLFMKNLNDHQEKKTSVNHDYIPKMKYGANILEK